MDTLISSMMARLLLEAKAVRFSPEKPFKLTSGNYSPIYVDCRSLLSNAATMDLVSAFIHWKVSSRNITFDVVAGGETAGIPFAAQVASRLAKPTAYVRKATIGHGTGSLVEGNVRPSAKVLLIEDLVTDGRSKLVFVESLRSAELLIEDCIVIFDRLQGGTELMERNSVLLYSLTNLDDTLNTAMQCGLLSTEMIADIEDYRNNPELWHSKRGLAFVKTTV